LTYLFLTQVSQIFALSGFWAGLSPRQDVARLCKIATLDEIEAQGWSLNPGRYGGDPTSGGEGF